MSNNMRLTPKDKDLIQIIRKKEHLDELSYNDANIIRNCLIKYVKARYPEEMEKFYKKHNSLY